MPRTDKAHFSPSAVTRPGNHMENASHSFQKYFRAMSGEVPMCDRLKYGTCVLAAFTKRGCQSPRMIRGASFVSHSEYEVMILLISEKTRSGSLNTFTSMLNLICRFSGCSCGNIIKWSNQDVRHATRTFTSRSSVSVNVGIGCLGSLMVRTCIMPSVPYQFLSRISPIQWRLTDIQEETSSKNN